LCTFLFALAVRERSAFVSAEDFVVCSAIALLCVRFVYWNCLLDPCLRFHSLGLRGDAHGPALEICDSEYARFDVVERFSA
jgi:hypothetical protein